MLGEWEGPRLLTRDEAVDNYDDSEEGRCIACVQKAKQYNMGIEDIIMVEERAVNEMGVKQVLRMCVGRLVIFGQN